MFARQSFVFSCFEGWESFKAEAANFGILTSFTLRRTFVQYIPSKDDRRNNRVTSFEPFLLLPLKIDANFNLLILCRLIYQRDLTW